MKRLLKVMWLTLAAVAAINATAVSGCQCDNVRDIFRASSSATAGETKVTPGTEKATQRNTQTKTLKTFAADNKGSNP